jgi:hypothetical protein
MPAYHGPGLNQDESLAPIAPAARQPHPKETVCVTQARSFRRALIDGDLPAQCEVFKDQGSAARKRQAEEAEEGEKWRNHGFQHASIKARGIKRPVIASY